MKKLFATIMFISCVIAAYGQTNTDTTQYYEAEMVHEVVKLNSRTNFHGSRITRQAIPFTIPQNAVYWYWVIKTTKDENGPSFVKSMTELGKQIPVGNINLISQAISRIYKEPNVNIPNVEVLITDMQNALIFSEKKEGYGVFPGMQRRNVGLWSGSASFVPADGTRTVYFCLRNHEYSAAVAATVQVYAVLKRDTNGQK